MAFRKLQSTTQIDKKLIMEYTVYAFKASGR